MAKCLLLLKVCQQSGERQDYAFNWTLEFSKRWQAAFPYGSGQKIRPTGDQTGFEYSSGGGVSGSEEPEWPDTLGGTVVDGSVTWTAMAISVDSLRHRIQGTAVWDADTGLTLDDDVTTDAPGLQETRVWVSGGVAGQTYSNFVTVTTDQGAIYQGELRVTIE